MENHSSRSGAGHVGGHLEPCDSLAHASSQNGNRIPRHELSGVLGHGRDPRQEGALEVTSLQPTLTPGGAAAASKTSERQLLGWGSREALTAVGGKRHGGINGNSGDRGGPNSGGGTPKDSVPNGNEKVRERSVENGSE